ncbi:hypothetical protein BOTBODRAFT_94572, partial [Botryobasidium botryosum FD-172 SS1]
SSDVEKTRLLIANYTRDLKQVKLNLLNSEHCPAFPDTEWTNVLSGRFIELDRVLSGMYSVDPDDRESHSFGTYMISSGSTKPAKQVTEHGQWINAWTRAAQAILFAFPHRAEELQVYQEHINDLFAALPRSMHSNVISYDRAVRVQAATRRDVALSDTGAFVHLHLLWIQTQGAANRSQEQSSGSSRDGSGQVSGGGNKRRDPCKRWNDGRCPNDAATCKYSHVCAKCRKGAHVARKC